MTIETSPNVAEAGWLPTQAGEVFCWYHPPRISQRDLAVLLCDPLGSDRMNLHLTYRQLAIMLSEQGIPTLRLDYPGTCDSAGSSRDPDRLSGIFRALNVGADYLRSATGVSRLALFGARFGATLAIEFAARRDDVDLLALWGAYETGRQYLRSAAAFDRMSGVNPEAYRPSHWQEGDQELSGFLLRADFVEGLKQISVGNRELNAELLIADWDEAGDSRSVAERLQEAGASITSQGLVDQGSQSLIRQTVPFSLLQRVSDWMREKSELLEPADTTSRENLLQEISLEQTSDPPIGERVVHIGANSDLFGVLTSPHSDAPDTAKTAILLVNGGNNHRVGINRNHTEWARRWAQAGFTVLRMDIRGLGDSPPLHARDLNRLYMERTMRDVQESADWLRESVEANHLIVSGYCAGAYQALNLARSDSRVDALMLIELLRYYSWEPLQLAGSPWKARILRYWARFHPMWLRDRGRIGRWFRDLSRNGTRTLVLYREDEQMLERFESEISRYENELIGSANFKLGRLSPSNHIISPLFAQEELSNLLMEFLEDYNQAQRHTSSSPWIRTS